MAIGVLNDKNTCPCENKLVLIRPDGLIAWQYSKAHPVPGGEAAQQARGDGRLREHFLLRDYPIEFGICLTLGLACWIAYFSIVRRLRTS